jgi:hypothetical protein
MGVYKAILEQVGEDAPVATVLENTLYGTPVWTRLSRGKYRATLEGAFPPNRTLIIGSMLYWSDAFTFAVAHQINPSSDFVNIDTLNLTGSQWDIDGGKVFILIESFD